MSDAADLNHPRPDRTGETGGTATDRRKRFQAGVVAASATYAEMAGWPDVVQHARRHGDLVALAPSLAAAVPDLRGLLEAQGMRVVVPDGHDPAAEVADVPLAIVRGEMAIAESGSVLVAEHALGDRVVTMLCRRLVQVVAADDVADRLEDAAGWLSARAGRPGFASLMTGPSRTADIERSLTIGVQGPDEVDVIVLLGGVDPQTHHMEMT
ncbi:MAG TPA: LUD domain-containing protein [Euzebya sp.]|nr:LUD domain-containing protein [Euzebya sp.]